MGAEEQAPIPSISDQNDGSTQEAETPNQGPETSSQQLENATKPVGLLGICPKCKDRPAEFTVRKNYTSCFPCLEALLSLKIKNVLKSKGVVAHKEHVAVAYSGGSSSSLLLEFMTKFRDPQAGPYDKQNMAFDLSVFHIVIDSGSTSSSDAAAQVEATARKIINGNPEINYKSVPLSDLYSQEESDPSARQAKLTDLLASIKDSTGKADLISFLQTTLLLRLCKEIDCKKLIFGYNAAAFAIRAVASAVKGAGYALPGDAQHVDSRHALTSGATVIYPMKELTDEEIDVVCRVLGLPCKDTVTTTTTTNENSSSSNGYESALVTSEIDKHNINALATLFVENVLKHNPGAVHNINSTISKLEPFPWNDSSFHSELLLGTSESAAAGAGKKEEEEEIDEVLCPLCSAPLAEDEIASIVTKGTGGPIAGVCDSCRHQIFASDNDGGEALHKLPRCVLENIDQTATAWTFIAQNPQEIGLSEAELNQLKALYC